jgi:hypothetical protein
VGGANLTEEFGDKVINGDFAVDTGWTSGDWLISGGAAKYLGEIKDYSIMVADAGGEILAPFAIDTYFRALKAAGIWDNLKSSALFAGVDFAACFVPLRSDMPTPTNVNFTSIEHNTATGLKANGSTMWIDLDDSPDGFGFESGANYTAHLSAYVTTAPSAVGAFMGAGGSNSNWVQLVRNGATTFAFRAGGNPSAFTWPTDNLGFYGLSKNGENQHNRLAGVSVDDQSYSSNSNNQNMGVFRRIGTDIVSLTDARLLTYTAGLGISSTQLATLDTLQTQLLADIAAELA